MPFTSLGLSPVLRNALKAAGYAEPTPIQRDTIPAVIAHRDVLGIAKTGSGKTASYVLPILHQFQTATMAAPYREPTVLVLVPTRELADQVQQVFQTFIPALSERLTCLAVSGGVSINQNLLFSATLSAYLQLIQQGILHHPQVIEIAAETAGIDLIDQLAYLVAEEKKGPLLRYLIKHGDLKQVLVFASSTTKADSIVNKLLKNRIHAASIHSKLSQATRRETLQQFKAGELRVLVATDLLARGIDIEFLPCVINYELPRSPKDYLHRIGRTGRAESPGRAISLVNPQEMAHFQLIQKKMAKRVKTLSGDTIDLQGY